MTKRMHRMAAGVAAAAALVVGSASAAGASPIWEPTGTCTKLGTQQYVWTFTGTFTTKNPISVSFNLAAPVPATITSVTGTAGNYTIAFKVNRTTILKPSDVYQDGSGIIPFTANQCPR